MKIKNNKLIVKIITVSIVIGSIGFGPASFASNAKIQVSTVDTKLKSDTQVHIKGSDAQVKGINVKNMKFIKEIAASANQSGKDYDLYPSITIAQAVLESNGGSSGLASAPHHNLFGIKGFYEGESVQMRTKEDNGSGNLYEIHANFKSYPSWEEALRDHDKLLRYGLNGYYSGTWKENAKSPQQAAEYLQGRYATDTKYASKLMNIIKIYNLERFDGQLTMRDYAWLDSDSLDPWELPVVKEEEIIKKSTTWASGFKESPLEFAETLKDVIKKDTNKKWNGKNADKYYVENTLSLKVDFTDRDIDRYKRNPQIGDIAVYKAESGDNKIIENYAVVEGFREDSMLISEGLKGLNGVNEIYRIIDKSSLEKFEFIDVSELIGNDKGTEEEAGLNLIENK